MSRDVFTLLQRNGHQLVHYAARQSLVSASYRADTNLVDHTLFSSKFQLRSVLDDFEGTLFGRLRDRSLEFDVLLWDLIDERRGLLVLQDGSIVTNNWELEATGQIKLLPIKEIIEFGSDRHFALWKTGVERMFTALRDRGGTENQVVFIAPQFARTTVQGTPLTSTQSIHSPEWLETEYRRYSDHIRERYPDVSFIKLDDRSIVADEEHIWGCTAYHFSKNTEELLASAISKEIPVSSLSQAQYSDYRLAREIGYNITLSTAHIHETHEVINGLPLESRIFIKDPKLPIAAFFNGAVDPTRSSGKPVFQRSSWHDDFNANTVFLSDPTYSLHPTLRIGWGLADGDRTASPMHAGFLLGIQRGLSQHSPSQDAVTSLPVLLYGSSAGGFQALRVGTLTARSFTIVNNPQLDWLKYDVRTTVRDAIMQVFAGEDQASFRAHHSSIVSMESLWSDLGYVPEFEYYINLSSQTDVNLQYRPFLNWISMVADHLETRIRLRPYRDPQAGHNPMSRIATIGVINRTVEGLVDAAC